MGATRMRTLKLPAGESIPVLGQGTWHMGEHAWHRKDELAALRLGIDLGMTLIDTAEMYGDGATEQLVAEAITGLRDQVFLVSKVLPQHADRKHMLRSCEGSLRRLRTDVIDLYLLHWRERTPLAETLEGFTALVDAGKIRFWGVSNFDLEDMEELTIRGGTAVQTDQVLYNLKHRGIEHDLLPWCREHAVPIMAYSPVDQGKLLGNTVLDNLARRESATPAQVALAWVLLRDRVVAIPKAGTPAHVRENSAALDIELTREDLTALEDTFPPPSGPRPLEMV